MRKLILTLIASIFIAASPVVNASASRLVTILTAPEPQTQLMAMVLTMQSLKQGASVHVLLCGPAADLARRDAPETATAPQQPKAMSPQGLLKDIVSAGGKVEVCAIYLPNEGISADALLEGIGSANPGIMAQILMADDTRLMSF